MKTRRNERCKQLGAVGWISCLIAYNHSRGQVAFLMTCQSHAHCPYGPNLASAWSMPFYAPLNYADSRDRRSAADGQAPRAKAFSVSARQGWLGSRGLRLNVATFESTAPLSWLDMLSTRLAVSVAAKAAASSEKPPGACRASASSRGSQCKGGLGHLEYDLRAESASRLTISRGGTMGLADGIVSKAKHSRQDSRLPGALPRGLTWPVGTSSLRGAKVDARGG